MQQNMYLLPLYYHVDGSAVYNYGPATKVVSIVSTIYMIFWAYSLIRNYKNLISKYRYRAYIVDFTDISKEELKKMYSQALEHPQVRGIVIGTRPDCIDEYKFPITYLEMQSIKEAWKDTDLLE